MASGLSIVAILLKFFSPVSREQLKENLEAHWEDSLEAAREADAQRREELWEDLNAELNNDSS